MKKIEITRYAANEMFARLGQLALGNLSEDILEKTMDNFNALRKNAEDFEALKKELFKRLYGDTEKMTEEDKTRINDFFSMLSKLERARGEEAVETEKAIKATHPDLYELRTKEVKVLISLLNKEVDIELTKVDGKAFTKGILMGNKDSKANEINAWFGPLFIEDEKKEADLSELDELLKD